jgi:cobalt-zinc-cadmium efflux system outer membrane protein
MTRINLRAVCSAALGVLAVGGLAPGAGVVAPLAAQVPPAAGASPVPVDQLVDQALEVSPRIRAARARLEAAQAAVGPAGTLPDPMLMAGIMNQPLGGSEAEDMTAMTMRTVGVGQTLPFPGKLALQRRVAEAEVAAAEAQREAARWAVVEEVRGAYYDLAFFDTALEVVRNERLLANFVRVTEARYGVGTGAQADVLKARVEAARLAEEAVALTEQRRAALGARARPTPRFRRWWSCRRRRFARTRRSGRTRR